jgi:transcriptional regulator with XRE-family HTH domain
VSGTPTSNDLASRLNRLFDDVRPVRPGGRPYTNEEVAASIKTTNPQIRVGGAYLSALRNGTKKRPSMELLAALARHFDKPISYFFDDEGAGATDQLARLAKNSQVRRLAFRALDLSPEGLAAVSELIEQKLQADQQGRPMSAPDHPIAASDSDS